MLGYVGRNQNLKDLKDGVYAVLRQGPCHKAAVGAACVPSAARSDSVRLNLGPSLFVLKKDLPDKSFFHLRLDVFYEAPNLT